MSVIDERLSATHQPVTLRVATPVDLDILMHHRRSMLFEMGYHDESALAAMAQTSKPFFAERLDNGRFRAWLAENRAHQIVAGGGVLLIDYPSGARDPSTIRPVIVNVYTEPAYRRLGIARRLMETMIDWCRSNRFAYVELHASDVGRHLYEHLGFKPTNQMRLKL